MKTFLGETTVAGMVQTMMTKATRQERKIIFRVCKRLADRYMDLYELMFLCELKEIADLSDRIQEGDSVNQHGGLHASTPVYIARRGGKVPADANPAGNTEQPAPFEPKRKKRILNRVELIDS